MSTLYLRFSPPHRVARRADASSLAVVRRALQHPSRGLPHRASPPRGENPGRFRSALLRCSPPRSSTAQSKLRSSGSSRPLQPGRESLEKQTSLDPLDLDAGSPVTSRSIRFGLPTELPLMGFSKDRPSIVPSRGVRRPGLAFPLRPSEVSCRPPRVPSPWFRTTPTDSPPQPRRFVSPCCRSWGSPRFSSSRNEDPRGVFLPFEVFPPLTAFAPALVRGVSSLLTISRSTLTMSASVTALLALPPFLSAT
jgi:hypothetical protein